jgi:hypothetical protein
MFTFNRHNKTGTQAQSASFSTKKDCLNAAFQYMSYDLSCYCRITTTHGGYKVWVYKGEAGLIQLKIELGLILDEDLLMYLHTNQEINNLIAERLGVMV